MTPPLWQKVKKNLMKQSFDESERGERKACLKHNSQKLKTMASGPITSWQISSAEFSHSVVSDYV